MRTLNYSIIEIIERYKRELEELDDKIGRCIQRMVRNPQDKDTDQFINELELDRYYLQRKIDDLELADTAEVRYDLYN